MKSIYTALLICAAFIMSQPTMAISLADFYAPTYTYDVVPNGAGTTIIRRQQVPGVGVVSTFNINVTAEGNYDITAYGISHPGLVGANQPSLRRTLYTTVDAGEVLDNTGAVVATMTAINLPTRPGAYTVGSKLYANGISLLPGIYQVNLTTSCNTLCSYMSNEYLFVVNPSAVNLAPTINTPSLPDGTIGKAYSVPINYSNPTAYSTKISINGLPSGLALSGGLIQSQPLVIAGTPTVPGTSNVIITATDTITNLSTSVTLPLTINDAAISFSPVLPDGATNIPYTLTFAEATGGTGSFSYSQTGLPSELTLTGNTISGIPVQPGVYNVEITATDNAGFFVTTPVTLNIIANGPAACSGTNVGISTFVARNPGFIVVNGGQNLLDHLWTNNLNPSNTIFLNGLVNWFQSGLIIDYTGVVDAAGCILDSLTVKPGITISTVSLPNGVLGIAYSTPLDINGGVAPYNTTVSGLPAGLSFDGATITGTPLVSGDFAVTVTSIDTLGFPASSTLNVTINAN